MWTLGPHGEATSWTPLERKNKHSSYLF